MFTDGPNELATVLWTGRWRLFVDVAIGRLWQAERLCNNSGLLVRLIVAIVASVATQFERRRRRSSRWVGRARAGSHPRFQRRVRKRARRSRWTRIPFLRRIGRYQHARNFTGSSGNHPQLFILRWRHQCVSFFFFSFPKVISKSYLGFLSGILIFFLRWF